MLDVAAICLVATALFAYVNHRFIGLPTTIGVMGIALVLSIGMVILDLLGFHALRQYDQSILASIDFSDVLMQKLEADPSRPRYIVTETGIGYRLRTAT